MRNFNFAFLTLLFLISSSGGVWAQRNLSPVSVVPDKSVAVIRVNWTQVRNNEKLKRIVNGDNFAKIENEIGLNDSKVTEWVIFSDIKPTSSAGLGIIIAGSFTSQTVIQNAKTKSWTAERIGTSVVYVNPVDNSVLLPIRNGLVAYGSRAGIEKLQTGLSRPQKNLISKPPFNQTWAELNAARQPIAFMIGIPQGYERIAGIGYKIAAKLMNLASFGIIGTVMETIGLVRCVGFAIAHRERVFPTNLVAMMEDEGTAWLTSGAVNLLKKAPSAIGVRPKTEEERKMLESMQTLSASYEGSLLSVKFDMPESALQGR